MISRKFDNCIKNKNERKYKKLEAFKKCYFK